MFSTQEQTTGALEQCSAAVDSLTEYTSLLQLERDAEQKALIKLEDELSTLKMEEERSLNSSEKQGYFLCCYGMVSPES